MGSLSSRSGCRPELVGRLCRLQLFGSVSPLSLTASSPSKLFSAASVDPAPALPARPRVGRGGGGAASTDCSQLCMALRTGGCNHSAGLRGV